MVLKPQDILVLLKLVAIDNKDWSYNKLAVDLSMSPAEVHAAAKRALTAGLAHKSGTKLAPNMRNLLEFLCHGIRYVFVPEHGEMARGLPTSYAAAPLNTLIAPSSEPVPVWPDPDGDVRGLSFSPLYQSVPQAARNDPALYELLAVVDAVRDGRARERNLAIQELQRRLSAHV